MIDLILLSAALFFGILTVYSKDNLYSAASLAAAAGAVGAYYAYLTVRHGDDVHSATILVPAKFAAAFLIFVIYIGAVMLLVIMTAAMYGGVQRQGGRYFLATTLVTLIAMSLGALVWLTPQAKTQAPLPADLITVVVLLFGVVVVSLLVGVEVARRV